MVLELVFLGLGGYVGMYAAQKLAKALPEVPGPLALVLKLKELTAGKDQPDARQTSLSKSGQRNPFSVEDP